MFDILTKYGPFTLEATRFYAAEIVNGLEYMHSLNIIHRDMKPENLILSRDMHLKITDFGTARILESGEDEIKDNSDLQQRKSKQTFCGTANYVSPVRAFFFLWATHNTVHILCTQKLVYRCFVDFMDRCDGAC